MSASELSSDSIWLLCFCESAQHQYYMPAPAEAGLFSLPVWEPLPQKAQTQSPQTTKVPTFSLCGKGEEITGRDTCRGDRANENIGNGRDTWDALWVMWLTLRPLLPAGPCIKLLSFFSHQVTATNSYGDRKTIRLQRWKEDTHEWGCLDGLSNGGWFLPKHQSINNQLTSY